jgi:hypothetical protein
MNYLHKFNAMYAMILNQATTGWADNDVDTYADYVAIKNAMT